MAAKLTFTLEAERDIEEAYVWYEEQRAGLGEEFLSSVDACIQFICRMPEVYEIIHESYRRALLRRFPYVVFYEYESDTVTVYSVFHTSRDPEKWQPRLP